MHDFILRIIIKYFIINSNKMNHFLEKCFMCFAVVIAHICATYVHIVHIAKWIYAVVWRYDNWIMLKLREFYMAMIQTLFKILLKKRLVNPI